MSDIKNIFKIKAYIKASTPDELVEKQLNNNILNDKMFEYNIIFDGKEYIAWFWADINKLKRLD
jgi:hypothetical protein